MISVRLILLAWLFACLVAAGLDPYEVLGVARDADEKTIKSQYRQLLKQYHPDKNPDPEAHERFIEVGEAYGILNDPKKRENFDRFGDPEGQPQHNGMGDMFGQFFHGHPGFGGQQGRRRGPDTQVAIELTLQDFYVGKDLDFGVEMLNICESCDGSGSADGKRHTCLKCRGLGVQTTTRQFGPMIQQFQLPCDKCQGSGETIANRCKSCGGQGTAQKPRQYNVFIAPGTPRNHMHVLEGEGDQNPDWVPGNLNLRFTENPRENWGFRRVGDNLYRTEVLTAQEAAQGGWLRKIHMFDDEIVTLKREKGQAVMQGHVDIVAGHGMPLASDHDEHGHLFVDYKVIPVGTSSREKDEL